MDKTRQWGFTLVEILIALTILAILATITSTALHHAFSTREKVSREAERLNTIQIAITLIQRDSQQATTRAIRSQDMHLFPAFIGKGNYLEFTRRGLANPRDERKQSTLKRIAWLCQKNQLLRRGWEALDTPDRNKYRDRIVLDNLKKCQFAYLNHNLQILPEWQDNVLKQNQQLEKLPKAILLKIINDWGKMHYLLVIPEAAYGED